MSFDKCLSCANGLQTAQNCRLDQPVGSSRGSVESGHAASLLAQCHHIAALPICWRWRRRCAFLPSTSTLPEGTLTLSAIQRALAAPTSSAVGSASFSSGGLPPRYRLRCAPALRAEIQMASRAQQSCTLLLLYSPIFVLAAADRTAALRWQQACGFHFFAAVSWAWP